MARPEGIEPPTLCLEGRRSIRLSYGRAVHYCNPTIERALRVSDLRTICHSHPISSADAPSSEESTGCQTQRAEYPCTTALFFMFYSPNLILLRGQISQHRFLLDLLHVPKLVLEAVSALRLSNVTYASLYRKRCIAVSQSGWQRAYHSVSGQKLWPGSGTRLRQRLSLFRLAAGFRGRRFCRPRCRAS